MVDDSERVVEITVVRNGTRQRDLLAFGSFRSGLISAAVLGGRLSKNRRRRVDQKIDFCLFGRHIGILGEADTGLDTEKERRGNNG